jgi:predicted XRE-type DNA-binding protein
MGYGRFKIDGRLQSAHRVAYQLTYGPIPTNRKQYHGVVVRHTCDNVKCCNPAHLRLGTQKDNARDTSARGRLRSNVLTPDDVRAIRADKRSQRELAETYGVAQSTVAKIRRREIHKGVLDRVESTQTESKHEKSGAPAGI